MTDVKKIIIQKKSMEKIINELGFDEKKWENKYNSSFTDIKYKKNSKNFSKIITGKTIDNPNIYVIPRQRGGPSYKKVILELDDPDNVQFCPISKGYSMQNVSSFSLGPVVGHGLCVVNSAFSKIIAIMHLDGSGKFNETKKHFWTASKSKNVETRQIKHINDEYIEVNGVVYKTCEWLNNNKNLWFDEWKKWHDAIRMSPLGSFDWTGDSNVVMFCNIIDNPNIIKYMKFVEWKLKCYIKPSYELFEKDNNVIDFLKSALYTSKVSLGLVHPMGRENECIRAIKKDYIVSLFLSKTDMACMPYVVAGYLLKIDIDDILAVLPAIGGHPF